MAWISLIVAGMCEMVGVVMINQFHSKKNGASFFFMLLAFIGSFVFLAIAMLELPMGTAYAIWTGIGASGGAVLGIFLFNEPKNSWRIFFIFLILASAVGLKLVS
ncbi:MULTISPECIES: DMT family transporter [Bacillus]|uniref:DMT family transporter n=1 Tax=Bacillus TaxID=1386 RepID=UPI0002FAC103|nr:MULTISPECIES: multidrug efflux SMR transporter [Bacillus]